MPSDSQPSGFPYRLSAAKDAELEQIRREKGAPLLDDEARARMIAFVEVVAYEGGALTNERLDMMSYSEIVAAAERLVVAGALVRISGPGAQRPSAEQRDRHGSLRRLAEAEDWVCNVCQRPVERLQDASRDHVPPKSKGGRTVRLAHKKCNSELGNTWPR